MSLVHRLRSRRRRRAFLGLVAAAALVLSLTACTPSGYQAERAAVAQIHEQLSGVGTNAEHVTCGEFKKQGDAFVGGCYARGWGYLVRSEYHENTGNRSGVVLATSPHYGTLWCTVMRAPDGTWGLWDFCKELPAP